jgi:cytochrome c peroxidase
MALQSQEEEMYKKILLSSLTVILMSWPSLAMTADPDTEKLGQFLFEDQNLSISKNQSCMSCHDPSAGFADPVNAFDPLNSPVSEGSMKGKFGGRNAPTASYAGFSPKLHWDGELFIGGLFWDGRASGLSTSGTAGLGAGPTFDPLADQAKGPFLNPVEEALKDEKQVVQIVKSSSYSKLFEQVFGKNAFKDVLQAYDQIATAIAAFERSSDVNKFNSKFDKFVEEQGGDVSRFGIKVVKVKGFGEFRQYVGPPKKFKSDYFSYEEADGLALFNADSEVQLGIGTGEKVGGMCYLCHLTERYNPADHGAYASVNPNSSRRDGTYPPLLTDFSYDNLGLPVNPLVVDLTGNSTKDLGLGAKDRVPELQVLLTNLAVEDGIAVDEQGKFKVSTLRNIADTAPYGHNGFFPTLDSIVHFYNTRDKAGESFPEAEVPDTVNTDELGNLGLSAAQEQAIVAFLKTLSDQ